LATGRQLTRGSVTDSRSPARIAVLPLENERWVSAFAVGGAEWDDVPGQHASAGEAVAAAVREIDRRLATAPSGARAPQTVAQRA
jgi:hypothetical protein